LSCFVNIDDYTLYTYKMKINLLHILLVLIALQSTMAVADLHQSHQAGQEHLEFDHIDIVDHDYDNEYFEKSPDISPITDSATSYDCHHCCHCHGVACHYLDNQQKNQFTYLDDTTHLTSNFQYNSRSTSPALRPPIV